MECNYFIVDRIPRRGTTLGALPPATWYDELQRLQVALQLAEAEQEALEPRVLDAELVEDGRVDEAQLRAHGCG